MSEELLKTIGTYLFKLCAFIIFYLTPVHSILLTVYLLLSFDLVSGLAKSFKLKIPITAAKLKLTVIKFVLYSLALIASYQIDRTMIGVDSLLLTKCISSYIIFVEFKCIRPTNYILPV